MIVREDMTAASDIVADSAFPSYQPSAQPPLASGKVRFVGEPVAMAFAPTRAEAEDIAEQVAVSFDELPALADVTQARQLAGEVRVHEHWRDNTFLALSADKNFETRRREATVVVRRQIDLARQCMVPMEGKAVLAYWDHQFDQLVVYSATQVPHMIRTILAHCLGLEQERVR
ncbi:Xanthine dehydrogenase, molybdenum binding subunit apoprotein (fragment) (plasmid) [Cupriavidus taiwanensis]